MEKELQNSHNKSRDCNPSEIHSISNNLESAVFYLAQFDVYRADLIKINESLKEIRKREDSFEFCEALPKCGNRRRGRVVQSYNRKQR